MFTGVHAYDDRLPDWSPDGVAAMDDEMRSLGEALAREYPAPASAAAFRKSPDLLDAELARGFLEIQRAENASLHGPRGNPALWTGEAVFAIIALMIRDFAPVEVRADAAARRAAAVAAFLGRCVSTPVPPQWADRAARDGEGAAVLLGEGVKRWTAALDVSAPRTTEVLTAAAAASRHVQEFAERLRSQPQAPDSVMSCGP